MYALTTDGQTVTTIATLPPTGARRLDTGAWVTPPADSWTADLLAACGWLPVTRTPRPTDDTSAYDWSVELVDGQPVETWTPRAWTPAEQADRAEQAARFDSIEERLARIEAHLWPPVDPDAEVPANVPTMADYNGVWPAGQLLSDGGKVWRSVTSVPLTTAPSGFPGQPAQWAHLFVEHAGAEPEPEPGILAWAVGQQVEVGDQRTHGGRVWTAKLAHTTHEGWAPSAATHAVWTDSGPA